MYKLRYTPAHDGVLKEEKLAAAYFEKNEEGEAPGLLQIIALEDNSFELPQYSQAVPVIDSCFKPGDLVEIMDESDEKNVAIFSSFLSDSIFFSYFFGRLSDSLF